MGSKLSASSVKEDLSAISRHSTPSPSSSSCKSPTSQNEVSQHNLSQNVSQRHLTTRANTTEGIQFVQQKFRNSPHYRQLCTQPDELLDASTMLSCTDYLKRSLLKTDNTLDQLWTLYKLTHPIGKCTASRHRHRHGQSHGQKNQGAQNGVENVENGVVNEQQQEQVVVSQVSSSSGGGGGGNGNGGVVGSGAVLVATAAAASTISAPDGNADLNVILSHGGGGTSVFDHHISNHNSGHDDRMMEEENDDESDEDEEYDEFYEEMTRRQMWLENTDSKLDRNLKVKLVITDANDMTKWIRSFVSPIVEQLTPTTFGMFHTALIVGPFKIEWNSSALCIPRHIQSERALLALDLDEIATVGELNTTIDTLANVITRWNTTMSYAQNTSSATQGNCQDFVMDVLKELGIAFNPTTGPIHSFLRDMKLKGSCAMKFDMATNEEFRKHFERSEKSIVFSSHTQLDKFVQECLDKDSKFGESIYVEEYQLLKAFDRAFWMRYFDYEKRQSNERVLASCEPLMRQTMAFDILTCEDQVSHVCACPFNNPRDQTFSFINKSKREE